MNVYMAIRSKAVLQRRHLCLHDFTWPTNKHVGTFAVSRNFHLCLKVINLWSGQKAVTECHGHGAYLISRHKDTLHPKSSKCIGSFNCLTSLHVFSVESPLLSDALRESLSARNGRDNQRMGLFAYLSRCSTARPGLQGHPDEGVTMCYGQNSRKSTKNRMQIWNARGCWAWTCNHLHSFGRAIDY